jgi:hypothetical protein
MGNNPRWRNSSSLAERLDSWRRAISATVRLVLTVALGFAAIVGAVTLAGLAVAQPVLAVIAFVAALVLVLRRQGGLAALAVALWRVGASGRRRAEAVDRRRLTGYPEDWK